MRWPFNRIKVFVLLSLKGSKKVFALRAYTHGVLPDPPELRTGIHFFCNISPRAASTVSLLRLSYPFELSASRMELRFFRSNWARASGLISPDHLFFLLLLCGFTEGTSIFQLVPSRSNFDWSFVTKMEWFPQYATLSRIVQFSVIPQSEEGACFSYSVLVPPQKKLKLSPIDKWKKFHREVDKWCGISEYETATRTFFFGDVIGAFQFEKMGVLFSWDHPGWMRATTILGILVCGECWLRWWARSKR